MKCHPAPQVLEYPSFQKLRSVVGHSAAIYHLCLDPSGRCACGSFASGQAACML